MIVPFLVSLWCIVDLGVEKRGGCGSVNVRINHGDDLQVLCIGAVMIREAFWQCVHQGSSNERLWRGCKWKESRDIAMC